MSAIPLAPLHAQESDPPTRDKTTMRVISRRALKDAIRRGARRLARDLAPDGTVRSRAYRYQSGGAEALTLLALLEAGTDPAGPAVRTLQKHLATLSPNRTNSRALRAIAFARLGSSSREPLRTDVDWLLRSQKTNGGWGENPDTPTANTFDTALAGIALGQASRLGVDVPETTWDMVKQFLLSTQNTDGGYGYETPTENRPRLRGTSHGSATAAAAVLWAVLVDRKQMPAPDASDHQLWQSFARTARWLEHHYNLKTVPEWYWGDAPDFVYRNLLLLACPALTTSRPEWKHLPGQLAALLLDLQEADGRWKGRPLAEEDTIATAWALLTLCQARRELQAAQLAASHMHKHVRPRLLLVVGRIHHAGDWNLFPKAEQAWSRALTEAVSVGLRRQDVFAGQDYNPGLAMVHLTGTRLKGFGAPARMALKTYLQKGGMVLIDPAGGEERFFEQAKAMLEQAFGPGSVKPLSIDSPLITGRFAGGVGNDLSRVTYTPALRRRRNQPGGPPRLWAVRLDRRIVAVLSEFALTAPSTGTLPEDCLGYAPDDAKRIALNVLLYTYAIREGAQ